MNDLARYLAAVKARGEYERVHAGDVPNLIALVEALAKVAEEARKYHHGELGEAVGVCEVCAALAECDATVARITRGGA